MKGIDISHHQNDAGFVDLRKAKAAGFQFCFVKCSQGVSYRAPWYLKNKVAARNAGMLFGAYHFADGQNVQREAKNFLEAAGELQPGEIVILDYETYSLKDPAAWCLLWLRLVEKELGFKPLLYTYHGLLRSFDWTLVSRNGNGLWAARYGMQTQEPMSIFKPATGSWPFYAIWQYCSKGKVPGFVGNVDLNTTDMSIETLKKYGKPSLPTCTHSCPVQCPVA